MTVQVRIEHCNETVPVNLVVTTPNGTVVIGPGGQRMVTIHGTESITITESPTEYREDLEE